MYPTHCHDICYNLSSDYQKARYVCLIWNNGWGKKKIKGGRKVLNIIFRVIQLDVWLRLDSCHQTDFSWIWSLSEWEESELSTRVTYCQDAKTFEPSKKTAGKMNIVETYLWDFNYHTVTILHSYVIAMFALVPYL